MALSHFQQTAIDIDEFIDQIRTFFTTYESSATEIRSSLSLPPPAPDPKQPQKNSTDTRDVQPLVDHLVKIHYWSSMLIYSGEART